MAADSIKGVARMWATSEEANQTQYSSVKRFWVLKKAANGNREQEHIETYIQGQMHEGPINLMCMFDNQKDG